jgi:enamine deaminase RidA (YjgF/YER057c/UK114 family)
MIQRHFLQPQSMFKRVVGGKHRYSSIVVTQVPGAAFVYLSGQMARDPKTGIVVGKGDMRAQIIQTYENIRAGLDCVGATFADVVRRMTFTTDIDEYYRQSNEVFERFFTAEPSTSTLLQVSRLGSPDMLVEVQVEAILEPERLRIPNDA